MGDQHHPIHPIASKCWLKFVPKLKDSKAFGNSANSKDWSKRSPKRRCRRVPGKATKSRFSLKDPGRENVWWILESDWKNLMDFWAGFKIQINLMKT